MEGPDRRVMCKTWNQVAACEERIKLMKKLIKLEISLAEVEDFGINIHSKLKSNHFKNKVKAGETVTKEALKSIMIVKLRDEKKHLKELMIMKNRMRAEIDKTLKKNSRPSRKILQEFREESAKIRIECRNKFKDKIEHLNRKYRESKEDQARRIPPEMALLGNLKIFDPVRFDQIEKEKYEVKIIGDIELDEKEMQVLKLHPKFAVMPRLWEGGLDAEEEMANSKLRMQISKELEEKKNRDAEEIADKTVEKEPSEEERVQEIENEARSRQVFNPVDKIFDERRRRVTDLKECSRITLPKPLPAIEEAKIELRRDVHKRIYDKYREENCSKQGEQRSNLTKEEQEGLKSLEKKIKEKKIIVIKTDKSSRFAVCSEEAYLRMGRVHTGKDKIIKREELVEIEKLLNSHCVAWGKIWRSGEYNDHRSRIVNSKKTCSENTADLYILLKDHKEGEKTRPIVTGCTSNTLGMSNNVASLLEAVAASEEEAFESISSEDMLSKTKKFNNRVKERREKEEECRPVPRRQAEGCGLLGDTDPGQEIRLDLISQEPTAQEESEEQVGEQADEEGRLLGATQDPAAQEEPKKQGEEKVVDDDEEEESCLIGCDVVALFPSLTSRRTGEIVRERLLKSKLEFPGFDDKQGRRYIILNKHLTGDLKKIEKILPWRRKEGGGSKPTMTGSMGTKLDDDPEGQWIFPNRELTKEEIREIVARCAEIGTRIIFENFCYKFGGEIFRQEEGGPIGARVTMAAARLVMQSWSEGYLQILKNAGLIVDLLTGYVDDVRQASSCLRLGMRYSKELKNFIFTEEARQEDVKLRKGGEATNSRMARICKDAMNDISSDLQFTVEVPEDFENERLPTLDFSLWMVDGIIHHTYYQKEMKTPFVVMERSAMSIKQKIEILSNEATRRLTNIDHEYLGAEEQVKVLEQMTQELKNSGYNREQSREIIVSGFKAWQRRLERRKDTGLYRSAKDTLEDRERKKLTERETWYIPRESKEEDKEPIERKLLVGKRRLKKKPILKQKKENSEKPGTIKAVMFAPYTVGSQLVKELREAENMLGRSTGSKLKIVERCGNKLMDILTSSDPWRGRDCLREGCLLCQTKSRSGKLLTQDCSRRSIVYETYCITCKEKKIKELEEIHADDENDKELKKQISEMKIYKYIGETGKSAYERGRQHLMDVAQLKPGSHILKHYLDCHEDEADLDNITFGMKIRSTCRSAFERQVLESVIIQQESSKHTILNSKSEYNRCALPRLTTKLGEKDFAAWRNEKLEDKKKEEDLERKIRIMRKERNKGRRIEMNINNLPPQKKRKLTTEKFMTVKQMLQGWKKEEKEEGEEEMIDNMDNTKVKRRKINEELENTNAEKNKMANNKVDEGEEEDIDWNLEIKKHTVKLEEEEKEKERKKPNKMIENYNQSWELLVECVEFLEENEPSWKRRQEERIKEKEKKERLEKASGLSRDSKKKEVQKKITEHFQKLSIKEQQRIELEEIREKRLELKRIKEELWKHRGKKNQKKEVFQAKGESRKLREKLEKILEAKERMRKEEELELERKRMVKEKMKEMYERKKIRDLERIKAQEERKQKIEMKKKQEKKWEMARWLHKYIEENSKDWEREKLKRMEDRRKKIEEWEKHSRFEKIRILKEQRKSKLIGIETTEVEEDMELYNLAEATETNWGRWRYPTEVLMEDVDEEGERVETGSVEDDDEKPDLEGLEDFCIGCVHVPCLCLLLKTELKLKMLMQVKKEEEDTSGDEVGQAEEEDKGGEAVQESLQVGEDQGSLQVGEDQEAVTKGMNSEGKVGGGVVTAQILPGLDYNHHHPKPDNPPNVPPKKETANPIVKAIIEDLLKDIIPPSITVKKKPILKQCKLEMFGIKEKNSYDNSAKLSLTPGTPEHQIKLKDKDKVSSVKPKVPPPKQPTDENKSKTSAKNKASSVKPGIPPTLPPTGVGKLPSSTLIKFNSMLRTQNSAENTPRGGRGRFSSCSSQNPPNMDQKPAKQPPSIKPASPPPAVEPASQPPIHQPSANPRKETIEHRAYPPPKTKIIGQVSSTIMEKFNNLLSGETPTPIRKAPRISKISKPPNSSLKTVKMKQDKLLAKNLSDGMKNWLRMNNTESISADRASQMKSNSTVVLRPEHDFTRNDIVRMNNTSEGEYCTGGQSGREEGYTGGGGDNIVTGVTPCTEDPDLTIL